MVEQVDGDMTERVDTVLHDTVLYQTDRQWGGICLIGCTTCSCVRSSCTVQEWYASIVSAQSRKFMQKLCFGSYGDCSAYSEQNSPMTLGSCSGSF